MNSLVGLRDLERNEKFSCKLVFPELADPGRHLVSVLLPLGRAILGARVGQVVECPGATGPRRLRIERVFYQPEAARDLHL
jgi:regulator of nucleoside diphosphate kinase